MADSHQRRGIGPRLLNELAVLARQRGITAIQSDGPAREPGVLAMVHNSDWPTVVTPAGPELDIALTLPDTAAPAHARSRPSALLLSRLLKSSGPCQSTSGA